MTSTKLRSGVFSAPFASHDEDPTFAIEREAELVRWLDKLGYDEFWIGEHHSGGVEIISSPELFIASSARISHNIKLGTGVISLPYHNPLMVANRIVQLDHLTRGRVMFGVGPGSLTSDALMLGIDPVAARERMAEALELILRLLRGEMVTYKSDWCVLEKAYCHVRPYTHPHPPVAVTSSVTPAGGRLAGTHGVGMLCVAATQTDGFDVLATNWEIANTVAAQSGKTMDRSQLRLVGLMHLAETREAARQNVRQGAADWCDYLRAIFPGTRALLEGGDPVEAVLRFRGGTIGTPDDAVELIRGLQAKQGEFGCFLQLGQHWANWEKTKKSYELYAQYVAPKLNELNGSRLKSFNDMREQGEEFLRLQKKASEAAFAQHQLKQNQ